MLLADLFALLAENADQSLFVVGDINQTIQGWKGGAMLEYIDKLLIDFPAAQTFTPSDNHG